MNKDNFKDIDEEILDHITLTVNKFATSHSYYCQNLQFNENGIVYFEKYISKNRKDFDKAAIQYMAFPLSCFIGFALIHRYGGKWLQSTNDEELSLIVELGLPDQTKIRTEPLAKVLEFFAHADQSLVAWYQNTAVGLKIANSEYDSSILGIKTIVIKTD